MVLICKSIVANITVHVKQLLCHTFYILVFRHQYCYCKLKGLIDCVLYNFNTEAILPMLCSHGLLSEDDKVIISSAPTGLQSNWLLLQCVIHLNPLAVLTFCQLVQQLYQPDLVQQMFGGK